MESYSRAEENGEAKTLNLITYVTVEPAHQSDTNALIPAIQSATERGLEPKEILADSLYGSDNNKEAAKAEGIEVVSPTMGQTKGEGLSISDFEKTETGAVSKCPEGQIPLKTKIKPEVGALSRSKHIAVFDMSHCGCCPRAELCPTKKGKRHYYLLYDEKQLRLAKRREYETTDEFKDRYRYRAGVEATMSSYDRVTGVKREGSGITGGSVLRDIEGLGSEHIKGCRFQRERDT